MNLRNTTGNQDSLLERDLDEIKEAGLNPSGIRSVLEELDETVGTANSRIQELETQVYDLEAKVRQLEASLQEAEYAARHPE